MTAREIPADAIATGDRLDLAGAGLTVTARVHGAWYLDCAHARWAEFELVPAPGHPHPNGRTVLRLPKDTLVSVDRPEPTAAAGPTLADQPGSARRVLPATGYGALDWSL